MSEVIKAFPLQWPAGWKRTAGGDRRGAKFHKTTRTYVGESLGAASVHKADISVADAVARIRDELRRMGIMGENIIISTNLRTRLDGMPRSDQANPSDPGAAVYWEDNTVDGWPRRCMAVDHYDRVEHNLAAIAATLEAMRAIERHGGATILDRAFTGFAALPAPVVAQKPWREVLGLRDIEHATPHAVQVAYRLRRSSTHPDREGGDHDAFLAVQAAYEQAARELGFSP